MTILLVLAAPAGATERVSASVGSWPPYIDFTTAEQGVLTHTVKMAFAKTGIDLQVVETSWHAAEVNLDAAKAVSFGWIKNADRLKRWHFSVPICASRTVLLRRAHEPPLRSIEQIKGRAVGWSRGYRYGDTLDRLRGSIKESEMPTDEVGLRHLLAGTIDFMPMDENVARQLLNQNFSRQDVEKLALDNSSAHTISVTNLHLVCNRLAPDCAALIESFNRGLATLRSSPNIPACGS